MKVYFVTTPQRDEPTTFPPMGALSVMNYLRKHGAPEYEIEFYNIDFHRPTLSEAVEKITQAKPDILAISAVVSTAYAYSKRLAAAVKAALPNTLIVLGGNMGASAEVLLRRTDCDVVVVGEGERIFLNLVKQFDGQVPSPAWKGIPGLAYLDDKDEVIATGYEVALEPDEIWDIDWEDLVREGSLDWYFPVFPVQAQRGKFVAADDQRFDDIERLQKRTGSLTCSKGCVARCTFCHRWDKGLRNIPVSIVMKRLDLLVERYNVGVVEMIAETFGSDRRWLEEFLREIEPRKLLWKAGGVRTSVVDPDLIAHMKRTGCFSLVYGNETGSAKMLEVMEKKVKLQDNYNAAQWTVEAGLGNIIQLVIGMPGETAETIAETIEYCKFGTTLSPNQDPRQISINFAQALPGTPLYEFGRSKGLIGNDLDREEAYLLDISDKDAADPLTCVNFTNYSRLTLLSWNLLIRIDVRYNYFVKFGKQHYYNLICRDKTMTQLPDFVSRELLETSNASAWLFLKLVFRGRVNVLLTCFPGFFHSIRGFAESMTLANIAREYGFMAATRVFIDRVRWTLNRSTKPWEYPYKSLRKIVDIEIGNLPTDSPAVIHIRKGR